MPKSSTFKPKLESSDDGGHVSALLLVYLLLKEVSQVKQSSVVLRVGFQCFPVVHLCLLWAASQSAKIIHGAGMTGV